MECSRAIRDIHSGKGKSRRMQMTKRLTAGLFFALAAAYGQQQAPPPADDHQLMLQLLQRVGELEQEVRQLKAAAADKATVIPAVLTASVTPATQAAAL